jgi:hypothetical protein
VARCGLAAGAGDTGVATGSGVGVRALTVITMLHGLRRGES